MFAFFKKNQTVLFYSLWLLINFIQAFGTELFDDEAYYWVYSKYLDWGYFDHPPMIALLIKAGYSTFHNELGVRLLIPIINTATLFILQQLLLKKNDVLFYTLAMSIVVLQLAGMLVIPDTPFLFFEALFFWVYRRFINRMNVLNAILWGSVTALMLYSKYHGVLVIIFTLASRPALFKSVYPYIAGATGLILFMPHLYWQYAHGFPSIWFHLFERNVYAHNLFFFLEYLIGQVIFAGPVIGWLLLAVSFAYKPPSAFERALKFTLIGVYAFFFISSFRGRVEANWTVPAFIPLVILSHNYLVNQPKMRKWVYWSLPLTLAIVFTIRIYLLLNVPPSQGVSKDECHGNKTTAQAIDRLAGGLPVVVIDSYQKPSKHWFYTGKPAFSLNTPDYRRNNFNYWPIEDSLIGKPAYVIGEKDNFFSDLIPALPFKNNRGKKVPLYYSFSRVLVDRPVTVNITRKQVVLSCKTFSPSNYLPFFQAAPYDTAHFYIAIYRKGESDVSQYIPTGVSVTALKQPVETIQLQGSFSLAPGKHRARIAISSSVPGYPSVNSASFYLHVK